MHSPHTDLKAPEPPPPAHGHDSTERASPSHTFPPTGSYYLRSHYPEHNRRIPPLANPGASTLLTAPTAPPIALLIASTAAVTLRHSTRPAPRTRPDLALHAPTQT
jgi:hypothetical protein